jgi:hypothetical protein
MVLRRICGPKWEEVTGGWWKLHSEDIHNFYSSPHYYGDQMKRDEVD